MKREWIREQLHKGAFQTPCYLFDMEELHQHVETIKTYTAGKVGLCYAMKANPFLIRTLSKCIDKIEVCSPGELEICKASHIPPTSIIFSGVNKTKKNIEAACEYGVDIITLESKKHWELLKEVCFEKGISGIKILPRLTNGSQFGMNEDELLQVIAEAQALSAFSVMGIHYFSGTQKKKMDKLSEELHMLDELLVKIKKEYSLDDLTLEYGAGLFVPYFEGENFDGLYDNLKALVEMIDEVSGASTASYRTVLELGRFFSFSCGTYMTTVEDVKNNGEHHYVIVDGGIHQLNYYGQNMAMRVPQMELVNMKPEGGASESAIVESTICGSLCTMADVLVRKWTGQLPEDGDVFAFYNAGSYSMTEAPALFLSRTMPKIYQYSSEMGLQVLREFQESFELNLGD